jgi:hypothetical protein
MLMAYGFLGALSTQMGNCRNGYLFMGTGDYAAGMISFIIGAWFICLAAALVLAGFIRICWSVRDDISAMRRRRRERKFDAGLRFSYTKRLAGASFCGAVVFFIGLQTGLLSGHSWETAFGSAAAYTLLVLPFALVYDAVAYWRRIKGRNRPAAQGSVG